MLWSITTTSLTNRKQDCDGNHEDGYHSNWEDLSPDDQKRWSDLESKLQGIATEFYNVSRESHDKLNHKEAETVNSV